MRKLIALSAMLALIGLAGCGMYGSLYLEEPAPPSAATEPAASDEDRVPDEDENEDDRAGTP